LRAVYQYFSPIINCDDVAAGNRLGAQESRHALDYIAHKEISRKIVNSRFYLTFAFILFTLIRL